MAQYLAYKDDTLSIGDTIRVHQEVSEGAKSRIQIFEGILIAISGKEAGKSFTVRKIGANNVGVEKIFPVNLPAIKKIEVKRRGQVRRSKLYYLRDKIGKSATKIKEKDVNAKTKKA
jgi:large subunit ribosomal protein L19